MSGSQALPWECLGIYQLYDKYWGLYPYSTATSLLCGEPVTDKIYFSLVSNNQATTTYVPILDGTNYREWSAQMQAYLHSVGYWLIVYGTTTAPTDPVELQKWTLSDHWPSSSDVP